jgi:TonB family protein
MILNRIQPLLRVAAAAIVIFAVCAPVASAQSLEIPTASAMSRVAKKVAPQFPPAARQLNISGTQEVEITVDESGSVVDAKVLKGNAMFSQASLAAVKQWKFTPLVHDGAPKSFTTVIVFSYLK